jgi:flagellar protein FlaI
MEKDLLMLEDAILNRMKGRFTNIRDAGERNEVVKSLAKTLEIDVSAEDVERIIVDLNDLSPIKELIMDEDVEDIMVNNTSNIFLHRASSGSEKSDKRIETKEELDRFVEKLKLYSTNEGAYGNMLDVHLPNGSRANIISSPLGYDVTIRNFKKTPFSILDLINNKELDYAMAARLWLYVDGLKVRPANLLIGGLPASGKTTLLNAMFSFFRPEQRVVTIEETYELNTKTQENCVRLETSEEMPMEELVKNAMRMRPDMIIIGEVRGAEANDMITAMNIGKICMGTIHASSTRDMINRLLHTPMNVPRDIIPVIDVLMIVSTIYTGSRPYRAVTQISEISGIETQVLLSDLYKFDYRTLKASPILPSVTYRDIISKLLGIQASDILAEERVRAAVLEKMNQLGKRDMRSINEMAKSYYDNPDDTCARLGLKGISPVLKI